MKKILSLCWALALTLAACTNTDETVASAAVAPEVASVSLADGAVDVDTQLHALSVAATAPLQLVDPAAVTLTATDGTSVALDCRVANMNLHLSFGDLERNTRYTLSIPAGALCNRYDPSLVNTVAVSVSFTTLYAVPEQVHVTPDAALTDPAASPAAQALYAYVCDRLFAEGRMAAGTMSKYTTQMTEAEWVYEKTGRYPALHCFDLMNLTGGYAEDYSALLSNAQAWHDAGGIVAAMWHWRDPSKRTNDFYAESCSFDLSKIIAGTNGDGTYVYATDTEEYRAVVDDIAAAKVELRKLADAGIPVLWRPLHEASGAWFWWGAAGPEACKALWMLLREELADLHNLIWVWTVQTGGGFGAECGWYPGHAHVDIVGVDIYEEVHGSFADAFKFAADVSGSKKAIALSECGAMPDPEAMAADGVSWAWCMPWYGDHTQSATYNGIKYWQRMMTGDLADRVIDRSEVAL